MMRDEINENLLTRSHIDHRITIFASGAGSNAQKIITHFKNQANTKVVLIVCSNSKAGVLDIAAKENIHVLILEKNKFSETGYVKEIESYKTDFIVLAGFLWKVPSILIHAFQNKIINIHPALLPAYGGKGMYGNAVHSAVIAAKEKESGISIHYVDEKYDHGKIIFQTKCEVDKNETAKSLAQKIHLLEHEYYPKIIDNILNEVIT
ncbi:MAG: phosphoribosylglycinamide formyltransferase [Bacteroidota bacterium]|nr:phosphoribosylglycinamide formyltransferase [Bacteroidota bacterium]